MPLSSTRGGGSVRGFGFTQGGFPGIVATGGTITEQGNFYLHTFNGTDTFSIKKGSTKYPTYNWFIIGAGSGGAGGQLHVFPGCGGAAGYIEEGSGVTAVVGNYPVVIGAGGAGAITQQVAGQPGNASTIFGNSAAGGNQAGATSRTGASNDVYSGGTSNNRQTSGGGAGAGQSGSAQNGGNGYPNSIDGVNNVHGGGGGGADPPSFPNSGGTGGGGNFAYGPSPATQNRGSGGGGGFVNGGGTGSNGVCFIKYQVKG